MTFRVVRNAVKFVFGGVGSGTHDSESRATFFVWLVDGGVMNTGLGESCAFGLNGQEEPFVLLRGGNHLARFCGADDVSG